jgi:hypothetical protein
MTKYEKHLTDCIMNLENAINSASSLNVPLELRKLKSIQTNLLMMRNGLNFDRKTALKELLDNVLSLEGLGYESALICLKDKDLNYLLSKQFENGFYELSNGERVSKDLRVILHYYINA